MSYLQPNEFVTKMVDSGESKVYMTTKDTLIRAFMAGAILGLSAAFAITVSISTGSALVGAMLFPIGFIMLSFVLTYGYSIEADLVGDKIASIGEARTLGYKEHGVTGWSRWELLVR